MQKTTVEIDFNDPSDLKKWILKLNKRRKSLLENFGYKEVSFCGSKRNYDAIMPIIDGVMNADISHLYGDVNKVGEYYVYLHCDPRTPLKVKGDVKHLFLAQKFGLRFKPFYVGKGTGNRCFDLNRNDSHRKIRSKIISSGSDVVVEKVAIGISEADALALESKLIDVLGLITSSKDGMLVNLDEGCRFKERRLAYAPEAKVILRLNGFK